MFVKRMSLRQSHRCWQHAASQCLQNFKPQKDSTSPKWNNTKILLKQMETTENACFFMFRSSPFTLQERSLLWIAHVARSLAVCVCYRSVFTLWSEIQPLNARWRDEFVNFLVNPAENVLSSSLSLSLSLSFYRWNKHRKYMYFVHQI